MTENKQNHSTLVADDAPDMCDPYWTERFEKVVVQRGRRKSEIPKVSISIQLDVDLLARFRACGPGWQSRINAALRGWLEAQQSLEDSEESQEGGRATPPRELGR